MLYAILICSDPDCARELEGSADELETMACECGCTLQALAFYELEEVEARLAAPDLELRRAA